MTTDETINAILNILNQYQFNLNDEKELQILIYETLKSNGFEVQREYSLENKGIVDFYYNRVGFELKIQGQKSAIYRQCKRYCEHDDIDALVLLTARNMGLPDEINGKPCFVYSMSNVA